ncbi:MAG: DoxX family protein [Saprospiraceae bacterium]|nr:DoxX family protein [Saprospiraceae bacterium]
MNPANIIISWICQIVAAVILLQTLYFKFSGAAESVYIFSTLGMEPWGRIGSGVTELIAGVLLLLPRFSALGGLISLGVITGALVSHLFVLGIEVMGDGGQLFILGIIVWVCSLLVVLINMHQLKELKKRFLG